MTIQTEFYNYQTNPKGYDWSRPPFEACTGAAVSMRRYLEQRWGLHYLGCEGDRDIVGGASVSTHAFGASPDMRYEGPGPGLFVCDTEIIPWLISTSRETGLQAIHHYRRSLIWRPPGTSGRPVGSDGWKVQPTGKQMGQAWALWLHLEFLDTALADARSIEEKLGGLPPVIQPPTPTPPVIVNPAPTPPVLVPGSTHMITVNISTVRRGSTGGRVQKMQGLINANFISPSDPLGYLLEDGNFGAKTEERIKAIQSFFGMTVDGIVGPKTWELLINIPLT